MSVPIVAALWRYDPPAVAAMAAPHPVDVRVPGRGVATEELVRDADVVLADPSGLRPLPADIIATMGRCRLIQQPAVGVDTVDVAAATARGIAVANAAGVNSQAVAEWVVLAALTLLRGAHHSHTAMTSGGWPDPEPGRELGASTVGLIGLGNVARTVARLLDGFGCTVVAHHHRPAVDLPAGVRQVPLDDLLRRSDVVSVHVPLSAATRGMLGAEELQAMRPDAILINSSRGAVVDEAALVAWLEAGPRRRAALDVFAVEPLAPDSPLRRSHQVLLSPHVAARTAQVRARLHELVAENLRRVLSGRAILNLVNGQVR
ncbi:2-hydroxyacid dehydrogenase [Phytoactinopolyspora limicola]|uniref:2-hydroxyacid dehydrogenase n=1 Tax=Phytoactinopolyspora limicola TaxID=2715536 RepID=UPI00140ACAE1|nr:2-hydroxyacid dehydrogenase [Phytoactinopolyspora limicola]